MRGLQDYEVRELQEICNRMGGRFEDNKCIIDHVNDELRSNYHYHGWSNYETWAMNLYLMNDESAYNTIRRRQVPPVLHVEN